VSDSLQQRIEQALADTAAGSPPASARGVVDDLLAALEAGEVRAAQRDESGEWKAVPWVKRGILLGFQVGTLTDMSQESATPVFRF
jgi:2,3,4,5-tetrahydropyridine-2-carboxylate N-succinyltransferase